MGYDYFEILDSYRYCVIKHNIIKVYKSVLRYNVKQFLKRQSSIKDDVFILDDFSIVFRKDVIDNADIHDSIVAIYRYATERIDACDDNFHFNFRLKNAMRTLVSYKEAFIKNTNNTKIPVDGISHHSNIMVYFDTQRRMYISIKGILRRVEFDINRGFISVKNPTKHIHHSNYSDNNKMIRIKHKGYKKIIVGYITL